MVMQYSVLYVGKMVGGLLYAIWDNSNGSGMYWSGHVGPWASQVERIYRTTAWGVSPDPVEGVTARTLATECHRYLESDQPAPLADLMPKVRFTLCQNPSSKLVFFLTNTLWVSEQQVIFVSLLKFLKFRSNPRLTGLVCSPHPPATLSWRELPV